MVLTCIRVGHYCYICIKWFPTTFKSRRGIVGSRFFILTPDESQSGALHETMKQSSRIRAAWRSSTSMIFWGVLALTIFGWFAAILEPIYTVLNSIFEFVFRANNGHISVDGDSPLPDALQIYNNIAVAMRVFEVLTIAGWVIYVIGLMQFRNAQVTQRGFRLTGSLNTACWLGLSAIFCGFIAGFLGMFGLLFRFTGWVLMLISLFKFRSTFGRLSWEKSWNKKAQNGANRLKTSYTLAIVLEIFPIICGIIIFFVAFGTIGSSASIVNDFMEYGMGAVGQYLAGAIGIVVVLILAGLTLWICKIVYLFAGWNKIKNGSVRREMLAAQSHSAATIAYEEEDADGNEYDEEVTMIEESVSEGSDEEVNDEEEEENSANKRNWIIGASIGGAVLITAIIILLLNHNGKATDNEVANDSTYLTEIEFSEDIEGSESPAFENVIDDEPSSQAIAEKVLNAVSDDFVVHEKSDEDTGGNKYKGSIDGKYGIEMRLTSDGANFTGEYWYINNKTPIQLRGEFTDGYEHLVLEEYVGMKMTGRFEGTLSHGVYDGTWISADGQKSYPFTVIEYTK